jgi:hypothetical protein
MSDLFEVGVGFSLEDAYHQLQGAGLPGTRQDTIDAPIGSKWADTATGLEYRKKTAGSGEDKWVRLADQDQIDAINTSNPWRPPAVIIDEAVYENVAAANAAIDGASGILDTVQLADGDRVLLAGLTTNPNVFLVVDTAGTFSFSEDPKALAEGDAILITEGSFAERQFVYDTTNGWSQINADGNIESGFIRTFCGKDGVGSEMPDYLTNTIVPDGDSLELGVGKLGQAVDINSAAIAALQGSVTNLQTELDDTQAGAGLGTDGSFTADNTTTFLTAATDLQNESKLLDTQVSTNATAIGTNATNIGTNATNIGTNATEISNSRLYMGKAGAGATLPTYASNHVVTDNDDLTVAVGKLDTKQGTIGGGTNIVANGNTNAANFEALDAAVGSQKIVATVAAGSTPVVLDTVALGASITYIKWEVDAVQGIAVEGQAIYAIVNTTQRDITPFAKVRVGNIPGLKVDVVVNGSNLELSVSANSTAQFTSTRRNIHIA